MAANIRTNIYCLDAQRSFTEEIRKKFDDPERYLIHPFQTHDDLIASFRKEKESNSCKIAIVGLNESKDQIDLADKLASEIKKFSRHTGIILVCPPERTDEILKTVRFSIDACIPQNANFILRVHNTVKKLVSESNIIIHRKRRNLSLLILFLFVIFSALLAIFAAIKFPKYF